MMQNSASIAALLVTAMSCQLVIAQEAPDIRTFDFVDITALDLALTQQQWIARVKPSTSDGFEKLVRSRPHVLMCQNKQWFMRAASQRRVVPVKTALYPLGCNDLEAAEKLLEIPFIAKWLACMREAVVAAGSGECLTELLKLATAEPEPYRRILLANLGARMLSLAPRNPQWRELVYAQKPLGVIQEAIASYQDIEIQKLIATFRFSRDQVSDPTGVIVFNAGGAIASADGHQGSEILWQDFEAHIYSAEKFSPGTSGACRAWEVPSSGRPVPAPSQLWGGSRQAIVTCPISPDQHLIFRGKVDTKKLNSIKNSRSLEETLSVAKDGHLDVFLSRPGFTTIGVLTGSRSEGSL